MKIPTGEDIRRARKKQGITQADLAERAGVSQPLIARIEGNNVDPTIDTLYSIVTALNTSTTALDQDEVKLSLPTVLKDARTRTGYTQGELAEVADVSQPLISRIERGDVNPRASTLRELFSHLDPVPASTEDETPTQATGNEISTPSPTESESDLIEQLGREFKQVEGTSSQSVAEPKETTTSEANRCTGCGDDLSPYPDPNYCPNCGSEL